MSIPARGSLWRSATTALAQPSAQLATFTLHPRHPKPAPQPSGAAAPLQDLQSWITAHPPRPSTARAAAAYAATSALGRIAP